MLAQIRNSRWFGRVNLAVLVAGSFSLVSCATKQEPTLVSDNVGRESAIPWNEQQRWENTGELGAMAERMGERR
jgi:hypothetical protein